MFVCIHACKLLLKTYAKRLGVAKECSYIHGIIKIKYTMNKVNITVKQEVKVDGRNNNTGRPVNKKSARQVRLGKQKLYAKLNKQFVQGKKFKINNDNSNTSYVYHVSTDDKRNNTLGHISNDFTHVCNVSYIGRTKVLGYVFVMNRRINVTINLKQVKFVK